MSRENMFKNFLFIIFILILITFTILILHRGILMSGNNSDNIVKYIGIFDANEPRKRILLNGEWNIKYDKDDIGISEKWFIPDNFKSKEKITIPNCIIIKQTELNKNKIIWYKKVFKIENLNKYNNALLYFKAVNWKADIWINGKYVGKHDNGYIPFLVDIRSYLQEGMNILILRVEVPKWDIFKDLPHGKQSWYGFCGGIWQEVWIDLTSSPYILNTIIRPVISEKKAVVLTQLKVHKEDITSNNYSIEVFFKSPKGEIIKKKIPITDENILNGTLLKNPSTRLIVGEIEFKNLKLWSPENPNLYEVNIYVIRDNKRIDGIKLYYGFRKIEVKNGQILLNGKPIYIRGALVQCFYPHTLYRIPSEEYIKEEIMLAKRIGLNLLRLHIKLEDPIYLQLADKIGILIWEEIPSLSMFIKIPRLFSLEYLNETLTAMILRDINHPSVIIWGIINEAWGADPRIPTIKEWLKNMYYYIKSLDPTRLVVDNSPCCDNRHIITDINDFHWYSAFPANYKGWKEFLEKFSQDPIKMFYKGYVRPSAPEPLLVSEFGVWGLPSLKEIINEYKGVPWWFNLGWGSAIPKDVQRRFLGYKLNNIWNDYEKISYDTQQMEFISLKFEIEEIRKYSQIKGYIITELYDVEWECNGLLHYTRKPKIFINNISKLNKDDLLIIDWSKSKLNLWSNEIFNAEIIASLYSGKTISQPVLRWELIDTFNNKEILKKEIKLKEVPYFTSKPIALISFRVPEVEKPLVLRLNIFLVEKEHNETIASNYLELLVVPINLNIPKINKTSPIVIYAKTSKEVEKYVNLFNHLLENGYNVTINNNLDFNYNNIKYLITSRYDNYVEKYLKEGGNVILFLSNKGELNINNKKIEIESRTGDWVTDFHYISEYRFIDPLPQYKLLDWKYINIAPKLVMRFKDKDLLDNIKIITGYFEGWIRNHGFTTIKMKVGKGNLIITTFNLPEYYIKDPVATLILNNILKIIKK